MKLKRDSYLFKCTVRRNKRLHHLHPLLGHDRTLDAKVRIPQRMGVLGVQRRVWAIPSAVLCVLADDDGGAFAAWV